MASYKNLAYELEIKILHLAIRYTNSKFNNTIDYLIKVTCKLSIHCLFTVNNFSSFSHSKYH